MMKSPASDRATAMSNRTGLLGLLLVVSWCMRVVAPPIAGGGGSPDLLLPVVQDYVKVGLGQSDGKDYRGSAMCQITDLDGNGVNDAVVGAYADDTVAPDAGAIYILYLRLNTTAPVAAYSKITSGRKGFNTRLASMDYFGASVAGVGDIDGDGVADLMVGALGDDDAGLNAGAVYLLYLQRDVNTPVSYSVKITTGRGGFNATLAQNSYFGSSMCLLGDLDGNGVADIAVGAYGEDRLGGVVYILFMQNAGAIPVMGHYKLRSKSAGFPFSFMPNDAFGVSVADTGDIDGDGVDDMAIGAYQDNDAAPGAGAIYLVLLQKVPSPKGLSAVSPVKAAVKVAAGQRGFNDTSIAANAYFGASLAGFGDLDNDGMLELMVGTIGDSAASPGAGAVHLLYFGKNQTDGLPMVKKWRKITTGTENMTLQLQPNMNWGAALTPLPDLNGDNITEFGVGSYVATEGPVYIMYKNTLKPVVDSKPRVYYVIPHLLSTKGGDPVTLDMTVDMTTLNISHDYDVSVSLGDFQCADPTMLPHEENDTPTFLALNKQQAPFRVTCTSTPGVGAGLSATVTLTQGGADIDLSMAGAVSYRAPVVMSVVTSGSEAKGGFDISVHGENFGAKDFQPMVLVHDTPCRATTWVSDVLLVCTGAPAGLGTAPLKVTVQGQGSTLSPATMVRYDTPVATSWNISTAQPQATAAQMVDILNPTNDIMSPSTKGGETMNIWGVNFGPSGVAARVMLGTQECTNAMVVYDYLITCTTPSGAGKGFPMGVAVGEVHVDLPANMTFAYAPPMLVAVVPESANVEGGDLVIMGHNFGSDASGILVTIGAQPCEDVKMPSPYQHQLITCKYPPFLGDANDKKLVVKVAGQTNSPRPFRYTDTFGQRTISMAFSLGGDNPLSFPRWKARLAYQVLVDAFRSDPSMDVPDGGVHIGGVSKDYARDNAVLLAVNISAKNPNLANATATWMASTARQAAILQLLDARAAAEGRRGLYAPSLSVVGTVITKDVYCPPGQQAQEINATTERACFACPVGYFQPVSSISPCSQCPRGADCMREGVGMPVLQPGFWRSEQSHVLPSDDAPLGEGPYEPDVKSGDPYFDNYQIYECNPPDVCLGGANSTCAPGHQYDTPLCAVCVEGYYSVNGQCQQCGQRRHVLITIAFGLMLVVMVFGVLLYVFVRPGADIDETNEVLRNQLGNGPNANAFNPSMLNMREVLLSTLARQVTTRLRSITQVPDFWSKAKISITFLQILASMNVAYSIPWPPGFRRILHRLNILNLNILNLPGLSYTCIDRSIDFFDEFLVALMSPILLTVFFLALYYVGVRLIEHKVKKNKDVVRAMEVQAHELRGQLLKKMRAISFSMKRLGSGGPSKSFAADASQSVRGNISAARASNSSAHTSSSPPPDTSLLGQLPSVRGSLSGDRGNFPSPPGDHGPPTSLSPPSTFTTVGSRITSPVLPPDTNSSVESHGSRTRSPLLQASAHAADAHAQLYMTQLSGVIAPPTVGPPDSHSPIISPAVRSAVIDIFSPGPLSTRSAGADVSVESPVEPLSTRSDGLALSLSGTGTRRRKNRKKASFSEAPPVFGGGCVGGSSSGSSSSRVVVTMQQEGRGGGVAEGGGLGVGVGSGAALLRSASSGVGSAARAPVELAELQQEDSILSLKEKLALLEKQQDVKKYSMERFTSRLITLYFWVILLIYPAVSRIVLEAVNCRPLDNGASYLVSDFRILCTSKEYRGYLPLVGPALLLYPVGIPVMFLLLLKFKRNVHPWDDNLAFLYKAYKAEYWWFEVYELVRKLFLTGLIIFVSAGTATQIAIACVVCAVTMCLHMRLQPYEDYVDDLLQSFSLGQLLLMTYCALLLKLDLTGIDHQSVKIFDMVLLLSNAVVVLGIMPASFYVQSKQYIDRFLETSKQTLPSLMKREFINRMLVSAALLLAFWASLANSVTDDLTRFTTAATIAMTLYSIVVAVYFMPFVNKFLHPRYRILRVLEPVEYAAQEEKQTLESMMKMRRGGKRYKLNLTKLNARKLEALRAAGLASDQVEANFRRSDSSTAGVPPPTLSEKNSSAKLLQGVGRQGTLDGSIGLSRGYSMSAASGLDGSTSGADDGAPLVLPVRLMYEYWAKLVQRRRLIDPLCGVLMLDLAVMSAHVGQGTSNYARMTMLAAGALLTSILCFFPQVKDRRPVIPSPLRLAQCSLALSNVVVLTMEMQQQPSAHDLRAISIYGGLLVSAMCLVHSCVGILRAWKLAHNAQRAEKLVRGDSVYGGTRRDRVVKDSILLLLISAVVLGLTLTPLPSADVGHYRTIVPAFMTVVLWLFFAVRPAKLLFESFTKMRRRLGQHRQKIAAVVKQWRKQAKKRGANGFGGRDRGRGGDNGGKDSVNAEGQGDNRETEEEEEDEDDMFDERDLAATMGPEILAAEVMRLRLKVIELEEKLPPPPVADQRSASSGQVP